MTNRIKGFYKKHKKTSAAVAAATAVTASALLIRKYRNGKNPYLKDLMILYEMYQ